MGFLRNILGIFNTKLMGDEIVDTQYRDVPAVQTLKPTP